MRQSFLAAALAAGMLSGGAQAADHPVVAFENVNVIPMDRERIVPRQTVIVRSGRIAEIGAAGKVKIQAGVLRVAGDGKYLMPGLAEMHGHLPRAGATADVVESWFFLYVANGVTLVRGMVGDTLNLEERADVAAGRLLGPTLYVAGPPFTGLSAKTVAAAEQMVRDEKAGGD